MIRRCLLSDKEKWYELNLKFMEYEYKDENVWENPLEKGDPRKIFEEIIQDPASPNRLFLIEEGEKAIGFINAAYFTSIWAHGKVLFIDDFFILEEFREKGYGKKALYDLEEKMKAEGYRRFQLLAEETNPRAIDFYNREKYAKQKINFFCKYL
ncbi:GNAT family N-acetyltransferase [Urinicoccus timonensis]|uniref:GNAT family N-acetyltransferase n=1 Tax=Urinicoccus timonensis TaxID=2024205 RepID=UPI000C081DCC|nr:GNAT family N-acetyltransferase [Urinicoccus timonensis]